MPEIREERVPQQPLRKLPFPPVTKRHILNCSYESWYTQYKSSTLKSRIIPLSSAFLDYLREDGLWLPDDESQPYEETPWSYENENKLPDPDFEEDSKPHDASAFIDVHEQIQATIKELGGAVVPKLMWSAPKDALHMALSKNSMECRSANDIYLLLKSSIFITHDLEHAFDDCVDLPSDPITPADIKYSLVLRPYFKINTAFEFRCFVKNRTLIAITQRELTHFNYETKLLRTLQDHIQSFFDAKLKSTFSDENLTFDVYLPEPHDRVRLIDINPWAPRTDPLLFSWLELLTKEVPVMLGVADSADVAALPTMSSDEDTEDDGVEEVLFQPEFRVVNKDDPEAYNFGSAPYSAHKLPREVVDASLAGGGAMGQLMEQWEALMRGDIKEDESDDDVDVDDPVEIAR